MHPWDIEGLEGTELNYFPWCIIKLYGTVTSYTDSFFSFLFIILSLKTLHCLKVLFIVSLRVTCKILLYPLFLSSMSPSPVFGHNKVKLKGSFLLFITPCSRFSVHTVHPYNSFLTLFKVPTKKLKKFEKEYQAFRESQLQQEDPIDRYQVGKMTTWTIFISLHPSSHSPSSPALTFISLPCPSSRLRRDLRRAWHATQHKEKVTLIHSCDLMFGNLFL